MPAKTARSIFKMPGVNDFCQHLTELTDKLQAIHDYRTQMARRSFTKSNHALLKDKQLHLEAQQSADLLSKDLQVILPAGLGFKDWFLKVNAGGQKLRWARRGSGGRDGATLEAGYLVGLVMQLCSWVSVCAALPPTAPQEQAQMRQAGLTDQDINLYAIIAGGNIAQVPATTPTLAYIRGCILELIPSFLGLDTFVSKNSSADPCRLLKIGQSEMRKSFAEFPSKEGQVEWSPFPELKARLLKHPITNALLANRQLSHINGQLSHQAQTALALIALRSAEHAKLEQGEDERRWVVTSAHKSPEGIVFMAPGPASAITSAALRALQSGPYPSAIDTWDVFPVGGAADPAGQSPLADLADLTIPKLGWGD